MPRKIFTYQETIDSITYFDPNGDTVATVRQGSDIATFILLGMSKQGHALKDSVTGQYACGTLDEIAPEGGV